MLALAPLLGAANTELLTKAWSARWISVPETSPYDYGVYPAPLIGVQKGTRSRSNWSTVTTTLASRCARLGIPSPPERVENLRPIGQERRQYDSAG